ncbi:MAG: NUDIX domain-containing protein [Waddliaceae bacterium]
MMKTELAYGIIPLVQIAGQWHVLLIRHQAGHWAFPKGHAEKSEKAIQAATRELAEETGLSIKKMFLCPSLCETYDYKKESRMINKTVEYFVAEVKGDVTLQLEELSASKWVPLQEAEKHMTFPEGKTLCRQVMQAIKKSCT